MNRPCRHQHRCRYSHGFLCEDCREFFPRESETYRRSELLSDLWCVLHNINCTLQRAGKPLDLEAQALRDRIGTSGQHDSDYKEIIALAQPIMARHGVSERSADMILPARAAEDDKREALYQERSRRIRP